MENKILNKVNEERFSFDIEKSHLMLGGSKNYMVTAIPDDQMSNLIETLQLFSDEGLEAWYFIDSNSLIHEFRT